MASRRHSTPEVKPRKKPHCRTCGEPMEGHKRGQCKAISPKVEPKPEPVTTAQIIDRISKLKVVDDVPSTPKDQRKRRKSSLRPGTVPRPRPEIKGTALAWSESQLALIDSLGRCGIMSDSFKEDDDNFLSLLTTKANKAVARVYEIETKDVLDMLEAAKKNGFQGRVIPTETAGSSWLIVSKDAAAVEEMYKQINKGGFTSRVLEICGGACGGASLAWAYLAYS